MTTEASQQYCCECGYVGYCPHMDKPVKPVEPIMPTITTNYSSSLCDSFDMRKGVAQMRAIDRAMKRYFGKELHVPEHVQLNELNEEVLVNTGVLCVDWLEARKKEMPDAICYLHIQSERQATS